MEPCLTLAHVMQKMIRNHARQPKLRCTRSKVFCAFQNVFYSTWCTWYLACPANNPGTRGSSFWGSWSDSKRLHSPDRKPTPFVLVMVTDSPLWFCEGNPRSSGLFMYPKNTDLGQNQTPLLVVNPNKVPIKSKRSSHFVGKSKYVSW